MSKLDKNLELRDALAKVDWLTADIVKLKEEISELKLRNEKLREICISLELIIDELDEQIKSFINEVESNK
jgi:regulator of replication initiation timing